MWFQDHRVDTRPSFPMNRSEHEEDVCPVAPSMWRGGEECLWQFVMFLGIVFFKFLFAYMGVLPFLPTCMTVYHKCVMPVEARGGSWIIWDWNYRCLCAAFGCWELNPGPLEEEPVLLGWSCNSGHWESMRHGPLPLCGLLASRRVMVEG